MTTLYDEKNKIKGIFCGIRIRIRIRLTQNTGSDSTVSGPETATLLKIWLPKNVDSTLDGYLHYKIYLNGDKQQLAGTIKTWSKIIKTYAHFS